MMAKKKRGRPPRTNVVREPNGRISRNPTATTRRQTEAKRVVLEARARHAAIYPADFTEPERPMIPEGTKVNKVTKILRDHRRRVDKARIEHESNREAALRTVDRPWHGCVAGRAIAGETDAADLWDVVQTIRRRRLTYLRSIAAESEHASIARLETLVEERFETRDDDRIPAAIPKTEEEWAEDAAKAWNEVVGIFRMVAPYAPLYIETVVVQDKECDTKPLAGLLRKAREDLG